MAVDILINQLGKPAGVTGQAREDLDLGINVDLQAMGGPFLAYQWTILDKPVNYPINAQSNASLTAPNAAATQVQVVDTDGTYLVQVAVDAGFGLGARPEDVARITFYAGVPLNPVYNQRPRRPPAYLERTEHNVPDAIFPAGNPRGWATEMDRWLALFGNDSVFAAVRWDEAGAAIVGQKNVAGVVKLGPGLYQVTFTNPAPSANYIVVGTARGIMGGQVSPTGEALGSFQLYRADPFGSLFDGDFTAAVILSA